MKLENSILKRDIGFTNLNKVCLYFTDIFGLNEKNDKNLIMPKNSDEAKDFVKDKKRQVQIFIPDNFLDVEDRDFDDAVSSVRDYRLKTKLQDKLFPKKAEFTDPKVIKNFIGSNLWTPDMLYQNICKLENHLENKLKEYVLDEEGLLEYFKDIQDVIFTNKPERFYYANELYSIYIEQKNIHRLLLLVFLSLLLCYKYQNRKMYYLPIEKGGLSPKVQSQTPEIDEKMKLLWYNKALIEGMINKYINNSDADSIKCIVKSLPLLLKKDENFKFLISKAYFKCEDYKGFFNNLKTIEYIPKAYEILSEIYEGKYIKKEIGEVNPKKQTECIEKAKELGHFDLILSEIKQLSNNSYDNIRLSLLLSYISNRESREHTSVEKLMNNVQLADYYYYKACSLDNDNRKQEAKNFYNKALEMGNQKARTKIDKKTRSILEYKKRFNNEFYSGICIVNSSNIETSSLLFTLPENYAVFSINCDFTKTGIIGTTNFDSTMKCIDSVMDSLKNTSVPVFVALLNNDDDLNLNNGLEILDRLFNKALDINDKKQLNEFIDLFDIYIKGDFDYSSIFTDASLSDMGENIYFKTHIIDPHKNSICNLLYDKPLFIPCLSGDENVNVCVYGFDNDFNISVAKEIMGVGYLGKEHKVNITFLSNNYKELENKMQLSFPGRYNRLREIITPKVMNMDFSKSQLLEMISEDKTINYIIVNIGSDVENIRFAVNLRRYLLINSDNLNRKPFIAVYCKDPKTAFLANRMTLDNVKAEEHYYNNYDLYFFGMVDKLYSYYNLIDNKLEKQALSIHLSYSNDMEYHDACNDYYSYQYNHDSSLNTAICLRYRLFVAGCYNKNNPNEAFSIDKDSSEDNLSIYDSTSYACREEYACNEQIRWNNFMISRGWLAPDIEQLKLYLSNPNITNHKYMLAKFHPYIANWDDLDDDGDICEAIKKSNKKFKSPKEITRDSVNKTTKWLSMFKENEQEKQFEIEH